MKFHACQGMCAGYVPAYSVCVCPRIAYACARGTLSNINWASLQTQGGYINRCHLRELVLEEPPPEDATAYVIRHTSNDLKLLVN
jgi:hypothetical protein